MPPSRKKEEVSGSDPRRQPARAGIWQLVLLVAVLIAVFCVALLDRRWILVGFIVLILLVSLAIGFQSRPMKLTFDVGSAERHQVAFEFNKFWGSLSIAVDDEPVIRELRVFSLRRTVKFVFPLGAAERHEIRIEKDRALILAGARPQAVRAYVDGVLVAQGSA